MVQPIPYVGGSIDILLSDKGQKWRQDRIESYISYFSEKIESLEKSCNELIQKSPEEFYDLFRVHLELCDKTRNEEKRKQLCNILLNQIRVQKKWNESETATRILNELTEEHVNVLKTILNAPETGGVYGKIRVSVIETQPEKFEGATFQVLSDIFNETPKPVLRMTVVDLVGLSLIKDEGVGRFGGRAWEQFSPLPLAEWFIHWIEEHK